MCLWFKVKNKKIKNFIFQILYIIVAPLCPAFLKHVDFCKAHRSEKRDVLWIGQLSSALWLAEYLKRVTEMLRPSPYCDGVSSARRSTT